MNKKNIKGVHAILLTPDKKVILQEKTLDYKPNPGRISMFGGGAELNEMPLDVLRRELVEELDLELGDDDFEELGIYYKNNELDEADYGVKIYVAKNIVPEDLKLSEGERIIVDIPEIIIQNEKLTRITKLALEDLLKLI
ncbi:hypothetical protein C0584_03060 [Candidatus Parcubacteria bacterium]|nr:MAG: hypothetical protein C0584_03060 [Candidatus Parcubacteria bacterium]